MVTKAGALTALVEIVKVAVVVPALTVTLVGTVAALVLLLDSETVAPPAGAGPLKVRVPVEVFPPMTEVGLNTTDRGVGGFTVRTAEAVPLYVAEMVTGVAVETGNDVTTNVAVVLLAARVTVDGTLAAELLLLDSVTTVPAGAVPLKVIVAVELAAPPTTGVGETLRDCT
jgi:hypothetical protein